MGRQKIAIGDTIRFRAVTRWTDKAAVRKVNGFIDGKPTVRFGGWGQFIVQPREILEITAKVEGGLK